MRSLLKVDPGPLDQVKARKPFGLELMSRGASLRSIFPGASHLFQRDETHRLSRKDPACRPLVARGLLPTKEGLPQVPGPPSHGEAALSRIRLVHSRTAIFAALK